MSVILLTAGLLKSLDWRSSASGQMPQTLRLALVASEWFMAAWLLSGLLPRLAWNASAALFASFLLVSAWKFLHDAPSCGCFGAIPVPPIYTVLLDASVITALLFFRPPNTLAAEWPRLLQRKTLLSFLLALLLSPLLAWSVILLATPRATQAAADLLQSGNTLILEPDQWLSKPFPLLRYLDNPSPLTRGRWLVLMVHTDCPDCQAAMARYRAAAATMPAQAATRSIAFLIVPSSPNDPALSPSPNITLLKLPTSHDWFASTPAALQFTDGIVTRVLPSAQADDPALALHD